jgi:hypothetical protein
MPKTWLKQQATKRGCFMGGLVEEFVIRSLAGRAPWRP